MYNAFALVIAFTNLFFQLNGWMQLNEQMQINKKHLQQS